MTLLIMNVMLNVPNTSIKKNNSVSSSNKFRIKTLFYWAKEA